MTLYTTQARCILQTVREITFKGDSFILQAILWNYIFYERLIGLLSKHNLMTVGSCSDVLSYHPNGIAQLFIFLS